MGRTRKGGMYYTPTNFQTRKIEKRSSNPKFHFETIKRDLEEKERLKELKKKRDLEEKERLEELKNKKRELAETEKNIRELVKKVRLEELKEIERVRELVKKERLEAIECVHKLRKKIVCDSTKDFLEGLNEYNSYLIAFKDAVGFNGTLPAVESTLPNYILYLDINSTLEIINKIKTAKMGWIYSLDKVTKNIKKKYLKKFCSNADIETFVYNVVYGMSNMTLPISDFVCYEEIKRIYGTILKIHDKTENKINGMISATKSEINGNTDSTSSERNSVSSQKETGAFDPEHFDSSERELSQHSNKSSLTDSSSSERNSVASSQKETGVSDPEHFDSSKRESLNSNISDLTNSSGDTPQFKRVPLKRGDNISYTNELLYDVSIGGKKHTRRKYKKKVR